MRRFLTVLVFASCKDKTASPPQAPPTTTTKPADDDPAKLLGQDVTLSMRNTPRVDIPTSESKLTLTGVTLLPVASVGADGKLTHEAGVFHIEFQAAGTGAVRLETMCRVGTKNLVFTLGTTSEDLTDKGVRVSSAFRPDPYKVAPKVCELHFYYRTAKFALHEVQVATACYRNNAITEGRCPPDAFPPPAFPDGFTAAIEPQSLQFVESALQVRAVVTVGARLAEGMEYSAVARCEVDKKQIARGEDDLGFLDLASLPPGASVEGPLVVFLDHQPHEDARCELQLTSVPKSGKAAKRTIHATYCLADKTTTTIGACVPALGKR